MEEEEEEIYEGVRANFPLSFGKQSKSFTPLESIHKSTLRKPPSPVLGHHDVAEKQQEEGITTGPVFGAHDKEEKLIIGPPRPTGIDDVADKQQDEGGIIGPVFGADDVAEEEEDGLIGPPRPAFGGDDVAEKLVGPPRPASIDDVAGKQEDEGGIIGPPRPVVGADDVAEDEEDELMIGPPRPVFGGDDVADDEEEDEEEEENTYRLPLTNEIVLKGHTKVVSALAIDPTGSRVLSGSYDYTVRMYDFQGMNARLNSFRQLEPFEGHQVRTLSWSPTADRFLCVSGSATAKIYDRDGLTLGEFVKGDMYIRDLKNTKGHITGLTCGEWNPTKRETILTSSEDGSLRIWDVNDFKSQKQVIKPKLARPARVPVTTCAWDCEGKSIAGGIGDGSIQIWNLKPGWGSRPDIYIQKGHSDDITCVKFSSDRQILLSRSCDGTLKVWDLRNIKEPLKVFEDLPNNYAQTNVAFSPDEQLFFTGTSVERESPTGGLLCFYDKTKLELVLRVGISPTGSVVQCAWHPKLNQVFATSGDKSQGGTHVLYDPNLSERGALACVARAPRKKSMDDFEAKPVIHNPHALPMFRDQPSRKRQREKMLKDPFKSHKPEVPMNGPGHGGRVGTTKGSLLTQYLLKQGGLIKETWMDEDPREAILKYADVAAKDPKFISPAYAQTQPETILEESDSEDEKK